MLKANDNFSDGITTGIEVRKQRGLEIAALARIDKMGDFYMVPSQHTLRHTKYRVRYSNEAPTCTCPDFETRGCRCKHIYAVEFYVRRENNPDGSTTVTEQVTVTKTRKTYPQDWSAYNQAQMNEKDKFQSLLADLCKGLGSLPMSSSRKGPQGRKAIPLSDAVFAAVFKIYSTVSARRFNGDLCDAKEKGYIAKVPHFNSVLNYLENPELYPILSELIERSSLPLKSVESQFAVDSTGFTACRLVRWFDIKYNRFSAEQQWVKAHICCGTKTNVVTAVEIGGKFSADPLHLPSLIESTAKNFDMKEVSADKGYSSGKCHEAVAKVGAMPYIAFKRHANGWTGGVYTKMFHFFQFKREEFLEHYHRRSNIESTMMMIKSKFGDSVRSKTETAGRNEVLAKILCHNICCLISAIYELGIEPELGK